jgi:light-regulated signal transduction histidine kinase (bacteriophytochrome)
MTGMIDALLRLSVTSQAPVIRAPLDMAGIAREVAEECKSATGREVEFVAPESLPVSADPALLRVLLQNLLANAWKFSGKRAAPRVEVGMQHQPGRQRVYYVKDNGVGFDESAASRLFGAFQRLHSQEDFPGTGIGLATALRVVRKHGGTIWANSRPGEGAMFCFTLGEDRPQI